jgi:putative exporter of polyketide antibiotics
MKRWFIRVGKRALLIAAILTGSGFLAAQVLRKLLQAANIEPAEPEVSLYFGVALGATGLVIVIILELLNTVWQGIRGTKPSDPATETTS